MNDTKQKSPDEIEREINETRGRIEDTLESLQRKLSPGELLRVAADYTRENGSSLVSNTTAMATNAGRTVRDNPIPLALVGIGLAWLMIGDRRAQNAYAQADRTPATRTQAGDGAWRSADAADKVGDAADKVGDAARKAADRVGSAATDARDSAIAAASGVRQRVEEAASDIRAGGEAGAAGIREGAAAAASMAQRVGENARSGASRAVQSTSRFALDHPLATGALMVAGGALLATLLPRTRAEDRLVGERSDRVVAAAADRAVDVAHRGRDAAAAAVDEAKSEAKRKGLTPERAKREAAAVAEAAGDVAVSAAEAAKKEFRRGGDRADGTQGSASARND